MTVEGTVVTGVIVLDAGAKLPEGARVRVEVAEEDDDDLFPPPEPHDREKEMAILRQSLEDVKAGRGTPFEVFVAELAREFYLPPQPEVRHAPDRRPLADWRPMASGGIFAGKRAIPA